ncbi:MAG: hypothetical protein KJP23_09855 [Deltaproteobacteria bacterium]|nr:hypothetical protein [Deltaproteobacteria bacterium]
MFIKTVFFLSHKVKYYSHPDVQLEVYRTAYGPVNELDPENSIACSKKRGWEELELDQHKGKKVDCGCFGLKFFLEFLLKHPPFL